MVKFLCIMKVSCCCPFSFQELVRMQLFFFFFFKRVELASQSTMMMQKVLLILLVEIQLLYIHFIGLGLRVCKCELSYSYIFSWASLCDYLCQELFIYKVVCTIHVHSHIQASSKDKFALKFGDLQKFNFYCSLRVRSFYLNSWISDFSCISIEMLQCYCFY